MNAGPRLEDLYLAYDEVRGERMDYLDQNPSAETEWWDRESYEVFQQDLDLYDATLRLIKERIDHHVVWGWA